MEMMVQEKKNALTVVEQKLVDFNGAELMAIRCNDGKIRVGVKWVANGIGLDKSKSDVQVQKIQSDLVLSRGACKINLPTSSGNQEILCLELDFLPLWLAKINANIIGNQEVQGNLVEYQLKAKDVLAKAFLNKEKVSARVSWEKAAIGEVRFAKEFAKAAGIRPERALAVALARVEHQCGTILADYRRMLPPIEEEAAELYTPSEIGERFRLKANQINLILEAVGLQCGMREPGKKEGTTRLTKRNPWRLTDKGKEYGIIQDSSKQTSGNKWEGFQILWNAKTIEVIKKHLQQHPFKEGCTE